MTLMNINHHLNNDPWFADLPADVQALLAYNAVLKTYQKSQMIHAIGDNDDAWTINKVTLISIPRKVVIETAQQYPILYKHLALITCARIRRAFDWIDDATSLNTSARLASMLMGFIGTYGKQVNGDIKIDLRLSQEELGFMLGTTRQTINKIIQSWQKQEFIDMHYGFMTIKNQSELKAIMNPE